MIENKNKYQRLQELTQDKIKRKLFGRTGLFGFYREDHKVLKIFAEYYWSIKRDDGQIPVTLNSRTFLDYIQTRDDLTDEEKTDIAKKIAYLKEHRAIRDLPPQENTLRNFALLLKEFNIGRYPEKIIPLYEEALRRVVYNDFAESEVSEISPSEANVISQKEASDQQNSQEKSENQSSEEANKLSVNSEETEHSNSSSTSYGSIYSLADNNEENLTEPTKRNHQNLPETVTPQQSFANSEHQNYGFSQAENPTGLAENITENFKHLLKEKRNFTPAPPSPNTPPAPYKRVVVANTSEGTLRKLTLEPVKIPKYVLNENTTNKKGKSEADLKNPLQLPVYAGPTQQEDEQAYRNRNKKKSFAGRLAKYASVSVGAGLTLPFFAPKAEAAGLLHLDLIKKFIDMGKNIITSLLFTLVVTVSLMQPYTAHAVDAAPPPAPEAAGVQGSCPAGWTEEAGNRCTKAATLTTCFDELGENYLLISNSDNKTICERKTNQGAVIASQLTTPIQIMVGVQQFLNRAIWPILVMTGDLMGNDLLFSGGMEERLREVWIPIRNLVNILFIVVLVGIALYNVLGLGEDGGEYAIKSALPKIILGIVAINFSFLAIKVSLDAINTVTTAVFSLPGEISPQLDKILEDDTDAGKEKVKALCSAVAGFAPEKYNQMNDAAFKQSQEVLIYKRVAEDMNINIAGASTIDAIKNRVATLSDSQKTTFDNRVKNHEKALFCFDAQDKLTPQAKLFLSRYNARNAALAMAINMGEITFYQNINLTSIANAEEIFINTIFSMILYMVYVASFLALFIVLLGRLVVLWLCIAVSPILLLVIAAPSLKDKFGGFSKLSEQFTKNAIAPLMISLAMTVGWIMLNAIKGLNGNGEFYGTNGTLSFDPTVGIPVAGMNTLQDFTVAACTIAVVWLGVFSAAEGTIAEGAVNWMKEKLTTAAKFIASVPVKHIPLVPIQLPTHEHHHNYTLAQVGRALEDAMHTDDNKLSRDLGINVSAGAKDLPNLRDKDGFIDHMRKLSNENPDELAKKEYRDALKTWATEGRGKEIMDDLHNDDSYDAKRLHEHISKLAVAPSDEVAKDLVKQIKNNTIMRAPVGAPVPGSTPERRIGDDGRAPGGVVGTLDGEEAKAKAKRMAEIDRLVVEMNTNLKSTSTTERGKNVNITLGKLTGSTQLKPADLQKVFTAEEKKQIKATLGDTVYKQKFGEDTPPPAATAGPAAPAAPAGGSAPAAPDASGGTSE